MISFIIPTFNEEKALPRTLDSLERYHGPREIIVADNRSTDSTLQIARARADKVVERQGDVPFTIAGGRNAGAREAKGEYLAFFDSDAYVRDTDAFFAEALAMFERDPRLVALSFFNRFTPAIETRTDKMFLAYFNFATWTLNLIGFGGSFGKAFMMRADAFRRIGGWNDAIVAGEDSDIYMRLAKMGRTRSSCRLVVYHSGRRQHALGWLPLIWRWVGNTWHLFFFGKAKDKEWTPVR
jgi:glycosyltransferase involved in cell wall biosynthesis